MVRTKTLLLFLSSNLVASFAAVILETLFHKTSLLLLHKCEKYDFPVAVTHSLAHTYTHTHTHSNTSSKLLDFFFSFTVFFIFSCIFWLSHSLLFIIFSYFPFPFHFSFSFSLFSNVSLIFHNKHTHTLFSHFFFFLFP